MHAWFDPKEATYLVLIVAGAVLCVGVPLFGAFERMFTAATIAGVSATLASLPTVFFPSWYGLELDGFLDPLASLAGIVLFAAAGAMTIICTLFGFKRKRRELQKPIAVIEQRRQ